jgi:hypothetical protein
MMKNQKTKTKYVNLFILDFKYLLSSSKHLYMNKLIEAN